MVAMPSRESDAARLAPCWRRKTSASPTSSAPSLSVPLAVVRLVALLWLLELLELLWLLVALSEVFWLASCDALFASGCVAGGSVAEPSIIGGKESC